MHMNKILAMIILAGGVVAAVAETDNVGTAATSTLEKRIALQERRLLANREDMKELNDAITLRLNQLIDELVAVKDSPESGGRIAKLKQDVVNGLKKNILSLKNEKGRRMAEWKKYSSLIPKDDLELQVLNIEGLIDERIHQIERLVQSMPESDAKASGVTTDPGVRHDAAESRRTEAFEKGLAGELNQVIRNLDREKKTLEMKLKAVSDDDERLFLEAEIEVLEVRIDEHEERIQMMAEDGNTAEGSALSRSEAFQFEQMMRESFVDLKKEWAKLVHLSVDRTRLLMGRQRMSAGLAVTP